MELRDFPVPPSGSKRGMHWTASQYPKEPDWRQMLELCAEMGIGWIKFVEDGGGSGIEVYKACVEEFGIESVIRFYQDAPGRVGPREEDAIKRILDTLGRPFYLEICNEPDLPLEWNWERPRDWLYRSVDSFCHYGQIILDLGALPGTFSLASGAFGQVRIDEHGNVIDPIKVNYLQLIHDKNPGLLGHGAWVSMHNYGINHPLDYPYDDVNRFGTPLTYAEYMAAPPWAWDYRPMEDINAQRARDLNGPDATIWTDDTCFGAWAVFQAHLAELGLDGKVPIITTEGGHTMTRGDDGRYCKIHQTLHADLVEGLYWLIGPVANYFTNCHWMLWNTTGGWATDWWVRGHHDHSLTIGRMKGAPVGAWGEVIDVDTPTPPIPEPPEPPIIVPPPTAEPELAWLIPDWNDAALEQADVAPGDIVWELVRAEIAPDNMANTVWVSTIGEDDGQVQARVAAQSWDNPLEILPHKPGELYNRPMWKEDKLAVWIDEDQSDRVSEIHGGYWNVPGVNAHHVGYILTFKRRVVTGEVEPPVEPPVKPPVEPLEEFLRRKSWDAIGVDYNPETAFYQYAQQHDLGKPETNEHDLVHGGVSYRAQGFMGGIVFALVGDWGNIRHIGWQEEN